jgi:RNA-directed DNA polymerase
MFRYCDDAVIFCQHEKDAERIVTALAKRLAKYKLQLNEKKTKCVSFSKPLAERGMRQETYDFLGFTFYLGRARSGRTIPMVKDCVLHSKELKSGLRKRCINAD